MLNEIASPSSSVAETVSKFPLLMFSLTLTLNGALENVGGSFALSTLILIASVTVTLPSDKDTVSE